MRRLSHTHKFLSVFYFVSSRRALGYCTSSTLHMLTVNLCGLLYMLKFMHFLESLTRASLLKYHNRKIIHEIEKHTAVTVVTQTLFTIFISLSFCSHMLCVCVPMLCMYSTDRSEITFRFACQLTLFFLFFFFFFDAIVYKLVFVFLFLLPIFIQNLFFFDSRSTEKVTDFTIQMFVFVHISRNFTTIANFFFLL